MSAFCERYGLTEDQYKKLIQDGVIPPNLLLADEVIKHYNSSNSMQKTADHFGISKTEVYNLIQKVKTRS